MKTATLALALVLVLGPTGRAHGLDDRFAPAAADAESAFRNGDLEGAVETLRQALAAAEAALGPTSADVAELVSRLALLELYANQINRAADLAVRALGIRQTLYGDLHPDVSASLVNLASIRLVQGRNREAGELYERNVDLWTRLAGPDDPRTAQARVNLADFYEASGRAADAQTLRQQARKADRSEAPAARCPVEASALTPPPWNRSLADAIFRVALEHEKRIAHALVRSVHHFAGIPSRAEFDRVFAADGAVALDTARKLHRAVEVRDAGIRTLLALSYAARERLLVATLERAAASRDGGAPDYIALVADVRRRMAVGVTRYELLRTPGWSAWIDDAGALLARRTEAAKLLRPIGFDVNNEIKYRPDFLACVAAVRPHEGADYEQLRAAVEIVARNAPALDAFYRFAGVDIDAVLKTYARSQAGGRKGVEQAGDGVVLDRYNKVAYVEDHPTRLAVHLDASSRDRAADLAALVSHWEHGGFPGVTRPRLETLLSTARRSVDPGALADLLDATVLDLRTRYPDETAADAGWATPRVGRWERSRVGREQHHTYYELQFDTHGSYAVPATDLYVTKRLSSPVGMLLAVGLQTRDLPKRALDAFTRTPPTLHVAVLPEPGLTFEVFAHPQSLTRRPGVKPIAAGETPLSPAPPSGWEIRNFGATAALPASLEASNGAAADHVLVDVRPVPGVAPADAKSFGFHACLLTPLDVTSDGRTVRFTSPVWRTEKDVPATARFLVYRRERGRNWVQVGREPLALDAFGGPAAGEGSRLSASSRDGFVELEFTDIAAPAGGDLEYRVVHRCALKPYPDESTAAPVQTVKGGRAAFEIVEVQRSPDRSLLCNVQKGYAGIARPWVKVRYRVRGELGATPWRDRVTVLDPDGQDLTRRNAVITTRDSLPRDASSLGAEHSLVTSVAACTEGPYEFRIRFEADGVSEEVAETLYVHVTRDR